MRVKEFYFILFKKTAKETASAIIDEHDEPEIDGCLIWRDLVAKYDHGGNREAKIEVLQETLSSTMTHTEDTLPTRTVLMPSVMNCIT